MSQSVFTFPTTWPGQGLSGISHPQQQWLELRSPAGAGLFNTAVWLSFSIVNVTISCFWNILCMWACSINNYNHHHQRGLRRRVYETIRDKRNAVTILGDFKSPPNRLEEIPWSANCCKGNKAGKAWRMGDCEGPRPLLLAVNKMQQRYAQDAGNVVLQFFKI